MVALYVTSSQVGAGKTAICAGLGKHLLSDGKKVGFLKPIIADNKNTTMPGADSDAVFIKHIFGLEEPVDDICPVISSQNNLAGRIKQAYSQVSRGRDVVIIEGMPIEASDEIIKALDARVLIVEEYSNQSPKVVLDNSYKELGEYLLGVVLNKAPKNKVEHIYSEVSAQLGQAGVNLLGVLPEDRVLFTLTIAELAEHLKGEILNSADESSELVENIMLGAMYVDSGLDYFGRKINKAVVLRGERSDMQLAALQTSTKCLILSGDVEPVPAVLYRAEDKKVPIISAKGDTATLVTAIEDALSQSRFNQEKKLTRLTEIMGQHFNFPALYQGLGLVEQ